MRIGFPSGDIARAVDLLRFLFVSPLQDTRHRLRSVLPDFMGVSGICQWFTL
jgi:hypothetical protein